MIFDRSPARSGLGLVLAIVLVGWWSSRGLGQAEFTPIRFAGPSIPTPPRQTEPWAAPATRLPRFLINSTTDLFAAGMADPRGCDYRAVEVGDGEPIATHGFVFTRPGQPTERFVVGWDGVVYPALKVGEPADLDADIRTLTATIQASNAQNPADPTGRGRLPAGFGSRRFFLFRPAGTPATGPASVETTTPLKVCLLLRLGRADLAENLFAAGTTWTPETPPMTLTSYKVNLATLAQEWANRLYNRAVDAFGRMDDVVALAAARQVAAFVARIEPRLDELGFPATPANQRRGEAPPHFGTLQQYQTLLTDLTRRAAEPPRGPIPGPTAPAAERVAALIRDLDQSTGAGFGSNGMYSATGSATEQALIREGDAAVEPLLQALETDQRLTRTISYPGSRRGGDDRSISPVYPAIYSALVGVFQTRVIPGSDGSVQADNLAARRHEAAAMRAFWAKNRAVPELERCFRRLDDPKAAQAEWFDAAATLTQPASWQDRNGPLKGEPLRARTNPSITDLMARRVESIAGSGDLATQPVYQANRLAQILARWDPRGALPSLKARVRATTRAIPILSQMTNKPEGLDTDVAAMTLLRQSAGDPEAQADYAVWARQTTPVGYNSLPVGMFEPLWLYPDDPALAGLAEALFADPKSPWVPLDRPGSRPALGDVFQHGLTVTPLLGLAPFRTLVLAGLNDLTPYSTVETDADGKLKVNLGENSYQNPFPRPESPLRPRAGTTMTLRRADFYAQKLGTLDGFPGIELWWPEAERDRAIAACRTILTQYGPRFLARPDFTGRSDSDPFGRGTLARLTFDPLDHPATAADVTAGRAIFHLDGAEVRVWPLPDRPLAARWTTLAISDDDPAQPLPIGSKPDVAQTQNRLDQLRNGLVWQAEEVRVGDRWQRYYGFVGHDGLTRVPAEEIEFPPPIQVGWSPATVDLDARVTFGPGQANNYGGGGRVRPGEPIPVDFLLRNHRGITVSAPADWFRDGTQPSVARGVTVQMFRRIHPYQMIGKNSNPETEIPLRAVAHHEAAWQDLAPTASGSLGRVDLRDLFPIDQPGFYRVVYRAEGWEAPLNRPAEGIGFFQYLDPPEAQP